MYVSYKRERREYDFFRRVKYNYFTSMKSHQITEVRGHYYLGHIYLDPPS
jgi:hypothetical protein